MPAREAPIYRRGKYWLDKLRREDGTPRSPRWYIFWYDPAARREASVSAGTEDADQAILELDRRYLSDAGEAPAYCYACGQPKDGDVLWFDATRKRWVPGKPWLTAA